MIGAAIHVQEAHPWVYVTVGWVLTGGVIGAYYARVVLRIRRAERGAGDRPQ